MSTTPKLFGPDRRYERWRWQIFAITWLAYAGFYLTRKSFSVAKIGILKETALGIDQSQLAWIDGAFLTAYALGQFFWGMAGDRLGTRFVILLAMPCSVLAGIGMGMSSLAMMLGILFFIQGLAQAAGWAPLSKNIANFFSRPERGVVMGLWCTNYAIGGMIASIFAGYVGERLGWRQAFVLPAVALAGVCLLFYLYQRNRPEDVGLPPVEAYHGIQEAPPSSPAEGGAPPQPEVTGSWQVVLEVLRNPIVLLLCLVYFCLKPARYAILFWGPKYVNDKLGTGMAASGWLSSMFELAGPFSVLVAGVLSDKVFGSRRMPVAVTCLALLGVLLYFLDDLPATPAMLAASLFLIGLLTFAPDSLISGTAAIDFGTKAGASTASGLINGCGSLGAIAGGTIPGFFYKTWGWHGVFGVLGGSVLVAALVLFPLWNTVPKDPPRA
ncbi:MAG TPA: MFS transporter [Verrucomicrobiales bacterium]|nr:MFS transporter [Verrucomicrobiales bacterium]